MVLQVPISEKENQDIAVIEVEKDKNDKIKVQLVGNEELYGKNYIVKPQENDNTQRVVGTINPAAKQDKTVVIYNITNNYNISNGPTGAYLSVSIWPMWSYMHSSSYFMYSSPWNWNNYPTYWQP